jgi:putative ABC transport system permease protein
MRHALRSLSKSPGFTTIAIFTLALGLGVNAITLSWVRDAVLRPLLRDRQAKVVTLHTAQENLREFRPFSHDEFAALRGSHEVFSDVAAMHYSVHPIGRGEVLRRRMVGLVSENFFTLLQAQPAQGRVFSSEESRPGARIPVVVASHAFWQRLGAPANFLGSALWINRRDYTVIGVMPPGFGGLHATIGPDIWVPLGEAEELAGWDLLQPGATQLLLVGSLQPDLSLETARSRLPAIERRLEALPRADQDPRRVIIEPPARFSLGSARPEEEGFLNVFASIAMGLSITVLLVACLNLANMLLARGMARRKEIAIQLSLGAGRARVIRQQLTEGLLLSLAGGAVGLLFCLWCGDYLDRKSAEAFSAGFFALNSHPFIDPTLIAAIFAFCLVATLISSLGPALRNTQLNLIDELKLQPGDPAASGRWNRFFSLRHCLVMAQLALSLALLFSAGLFIRGAWAARAIDFGFQPAGRFATFLDHGAHLSSNEIRRRQQAILERAATLPGVKHAALASNVPYNFELSWRPVFASNLTGDKTRPGFPAGYTAVSHGYFATLGIPLLRGRDFTRAEATESGGPFVAVIDTTLARTLFGDADPLGRHFFVNQADAQADRLERAVEVIGIVNSPRDDVFTENAPPRFYRPLGQAPEKHVYLHVSAPHASAITGTLRAELRALDPELAALPIQPLSDFIDKNINTLTVDLAGTVFGGFGLVALVLAVVGVYGVKAHAVARRTREIGIRLALGAQTSDVMRLIMKQGVWQTLTGLFVGMLLAFGAGKILSHMLYRISPLDPFAFGLSAIVLTAAALLACWLPARRATRIDPIIALRME